MKTNSTLIARYSLPAFIVLTPLISNAVALFLPIPTTSIALLIILIPVIMAILLTALAEGRQSLTTLLKKLIQWRISLKWYAVAMLMPAGIILTGAVLAFMLGWTPAIEFSIPERSMLIANGVVAMIVAIMEEFGWRGYALPRLLARRSPLTSALLIGIAWGILHIGIGLSAGRPWLPTLLSPLAASIVLTWLFIHTCGSLAMAILYHFALDFVPQFFLLPLGLTDAQIVWAQTIPNLAVAFVLVFVFGVNLQRKSMKEPVMA